MDNLQSIEDEALALIESADSLTQLDDVRVRFLGKKGLISAQMKMLGQLSAERRPEAGLVINAVRDRVTQTLEAKKTALEVEAESQSLMRDSVDVTMPGRPQEIGGLTSGDPHSRPFEQTLCKSGLCRCDRARN